MEIKYGNKLIKNHVSLLPSQSQYKPQIKFTIFPNQVYTLIMYDPDAPVGDFIHWVVTNISKNNKLGDTLLDYMGPSPPKGTGIHRYIFLLYRQRHVINVGSIKRVYPLNSLLNRLELTNNDLVFEKQFKAKYETKGGTKNRKYKNKFIKKTKKNKKY